MQVHGNINTYASYQYGFGFISTIQRQRAVASADDRIAAADDRDHSVYAARQIVRLQKSIEAIRLMAEPHQIDARATSASDLGFDTTETFTTLRSTEEINTTPTSISTHGPVGAASTAQAQISGEYDGSNGSGTLTFKVTQEGTHGEDNLQIRVYDPNNDEIDRISIVKNDPIDQQYSLSNGLVLSLGEGDLARNDTFTVDVSDGAPTSFSPSEPAWDSATDIISLGGVYDGSNGTDTLTFIVTRGGTHGEDDLQIKVYDSSNAQIDRIDIDRNDPIDQQYSLSNGLTLTVGAGDLLKDTTFTVDVFDSVGSAVDPDRPFNGVGSDDPNLESGQAITTGSFQINGVEIEVWDDDTINSVLDRISQSDAGVTATFDAATETVLLTQKTAGAAYDIVLQNDTSGFLAAMKLDQATPIPGEELEIEKPLAQVDRFSAVQSGNISVNGVSISIDVNTDSLADILDRINDSAAQATATFDSASQRVSLVSANPGHELILESGATNFFPAIEITDGTYRPETDIRRAGFVFDPFRELENVVSENVDRYTASDGSPAGTNQKQALSAEDARMVGNLVGIIAKSMNALFDNSVSGSTLSSAIEQARNEVRGAISAAFDSEGPAFKTGFGIDFDFDDKKGRVFEFSQADRRRLETALITPQGLTSFRDLLFGGESSGLLEQLHGVLSTAGSDLQGEVGSTGLFVDLSV